MNPSENPEIMNKPSETPKTMGRREFLKKGPLFLLATLISSVVASARAQMQPLLLAFRPQEGDEDPEIPLLESIDRVPDGEIKPFEFFDEDIQRLRPGPSGNLWSLTSKGELLYCERESGRAFLLFYIGTDGRVQKVRIPIGQGPNDISDTVFSIFSDSEGNIYIRDRKGITLCKNPFDPNQRNERLKNIQIKQRNSVVFRVEGGCIVIPDSTEIKTTSAIFPEPAEKQGSIDVEFIPDEGDSSSVINFAISDSIQVPKFSSGKKPEIPIEPADDIPFRGESPDKKIVWVRPRGHHFLIRIDFSDDSPVANKIPLPDSRGISEDWAERQFEQKKKKFYEELPEHSSKWNMVLAKQEKFPAVRHMILVEGVPVWMNWDNPDANKGGVWMMKKEGDSYRPVEINQSDPQYIPPQCFPYLLSVQDGWAYLKVQQGGDEGGWGFARCKVSEVKATLEGFGMIER